MKTRYAPLAALCLAILALYAVLPAAADTASQNFDTWPRTSPNTLTNNSWVIGSTNFNYPQITNQVPLSGTYSLRFLTTSRDAFLQLPYVTNGAGTLKYYVRSSPATNFLVQSSSDATTWTTLASLLTTSTTAYALYTVNINQYGSNYYRIFLPGGSGITSLFMEDVSLSEPIAQLQVDSATAKTVMNSPDIYSGDQVHINAAVTPLGLVSNAAMTLYYRVGLNGVTNTIGMSSNGVNSFITSSPIPGQTAGKVYYYVRSTFSGPSPNGAVSPTNYPAVGFTNTFYYTVAERSYSVSNSSLITTGTLASTLNIVKNYEWESFISYTGTAFSFKFQGVNIATLATNTWGDTNQSGTTPPFEQAGDPGAASIQVTPSTNVGQLVLRFKEVTSQYGVKEVAAETFDSWTAPSLGSYTNGAGWVLQNGLVESQPELRLRNNYAVLDSNTAAFLRSPYLPLGVGEVSLWVRNYNTNGQPAAGAIVEKSATGGTNSAEWTGILSTNGLTTNSVGQAYFQRLTVILSDRNAHYIRVRNATNTVRVCLEEVMAAQPGAGVQFSGTTNSPAAPTATNPVAILSTITAQGGASNLAAKIWYRSGTTGAWASITMTNAGSAYSTLTNIPAARGDLPGGAGLVQYYLECSFLGYESAYVIPFFYPEGGSAAPLSYTIRSATAQLSNPQTDPATPVIGTATRLLVDATLLDAASNITLTAYYRLSGSGGYTALAMSLYSNSTYRTTGTIPSQSTAGTLLEYYFTADFLGPNAVTPTNYPSAAPASVFTTTFRQLMQNTSMVVTGSLVSAMYVSDANQWETVIPYTGAAFTAQFKGDSNGTLRTWGESNQSTSIPPFSLTAELSAGTLAIAPTTNNGSLLFRFNEASRNYTIKQAIFQTFNGWDVPAAGNSTNNGWVLNQALTASNALLQLRGRYLVLESNTPSWIVSAYAPGGLGEISFWHRNANSATPPEAGLIVEKSATGGTNASDWVYLAAVTNVSYSEYTRFTLVHPDRNAFYVRVRNSTNWPNTRVCIDDLLVAQPGAGVAFTNVLHSPASPTATNAVSVSATITPDGGASNLTANVWYRSGSTGVWSSIVLDPSGNTFTSHTPIPAGLGDRIGGAGLVQYYIECTYAGYESTLSSPLFYPASGSAYPGSYTVQSAWLLVTNPVTAPAVPLTGAGTRLRLDLLPQAAASDIIATAWYRFGGSGAFTSLAMGLLSSNTYQTLSDLPVQNNPGQPLHYYFTMSFGGPDPATPTNAPANAPASFYQTVYHAPSWTSAYSTVAVTGDVARTLTRMSDQGWRGVLTVTNAANARFRFAGSGTTSPLWRDLNQGPTVFPIYGTAETNGSDMVMTGTVSGSLVFQFNDTNLQYSVQRASYADIATWPTSNIWSTNITGWVLGGRAGRVNDPDDSLRVLDGPFMVLQGGTSTNNFLRSPGLTNGIGEVSFFYRNWYTDGSRPVSFVVEASPTNVAATNNWTVLQQVTNMLSTDYRFFYTVLPDAWTNRYIRIRNTSPAIDDRLCIDETLISDSGAYLVFSNATYSPASPTIMDQVDISVSIYSRAGATNFTPVLWYKATTNPAGFYESVTMTNVSGALYRGAVPRGPIGPMSFFFQSGYSGFLADYTSPQTYPRDGSAAAFAYTNADAGLFENFDTWPLFTATTGSDYTNGNWIMYNGISRGDGNFVGAPGSTNRAFWFMRDGYQSLPEGSSLLTPVITNLYGTVYLTFMMNVINSTLPNTVGIYTTYDAVPIMDFSNTNIWTYYTSVSCVTTGSVWVSKGPISFTNNLFRILIVKEEGTVYTGLDKVEIAQRSAMITFSNLVMNPGYPSTNEAVLISCNIDTLQPGMPAFNMQPTLYYRNTASGAYGSNTMGRVAGSRRFTNSIPAAMAVWDTNTTFYISCRFDGYAHTASLSESPMLYPTNYPSATFSFNPRLKPSDYGTMDLSGNRGSATMSLLENYTWQGILRLSTTVNGMTFSFNGADYATTNGLSTTITNWGRPTDQWKTNLPLADTALSTNYNSIVLAGTLSGQLAARLNERTGEFTLQSCQAQDFDTWPFTAGSYVLSGNSDSDSFTNDFNFWPMNAMREQFDNFDITTTWSNSSGGGRGINYYTNMWFGGLASWGVDKAMVLLTNGAINSAATMLSSNVNLGQVMNSQAGFSPLEGVGLVSFWYKVVDTNIPTTLEVNLAPTNGYGTPGTWELIASITNISLPGTNSFTMIVNTSAYRSIIIKHSSGQARMMIDNLRFTDYAATYFATNGWVGSEIWMQPQSGYSGRYTNGSNAAIEFDGRRFNTNAYLETPLMTNGVGFFSFYHRSATNTAPVSFDIIFYRGSGESVTPEKIASVTNSSMAWQAYSLTIMTNAMGYIRLIPTSANRLFIDDVQITGIPPANSWEANNARIDSEDGLRFRATGVYLNNGLLDTIPGKVNTLEWPYVKTPQTPLGVGEISFWYRNWMASSPTPGTLRIQTSVNGLTGNTNWTEVAVISNIVNTGFQYYRTNLYDADIRYVRIINDTNLAVKSRIVLDEILVAQPSAADLRITNLRVSPEVPVPTNSVHVYADVKDRFLFPSNIWLAVEYSVGTNYGAWSVTNIQTMDLYSSNLATRTYTYRTSDPIPQQGADKFVMYQIRAYFDGLNAAGHTSPKLGREFSTPAYYYPLNYGTNVPYYIVYGSATNAVWINEIDPGNPFIATAHLYDFVEIAGAQGINIGNWKIAFVTTANPTQVMVSYTIDPGTVLPADTNGVGFYLLGKNTLSVTPDKLLTNDIPYPGGVALQRPAGMYSIKLCFADYASDVSSLTQKGYTYIGADSDGLFDEWGPRSILLVGTGSVGSAFSWRSATFDDPEATPGSVNWLQSLVGTSTPVNNPPTDVQIVNFWFASQKIWITVTGTNGWLPSPWFTTNLMVPGSWTNVASFERFALTNWTYTMRFPIPSNYPAYFYKVVTTNASN
jgi:hypothetical protein